MDPRCHLAQAVPSTLSLAFSLGFLMATARPAQSLITIQRTQDQLLGRCALSGWQDRNLKLAVLCHTLEGPASRMNNTIKQYPTLLHIKHSHLWKVHKLVKRAYLRILNASLVTLCFRRAAPTQTACFLEACLYQALGPLQEAPRSKNCSSWSVFCPHFKPCKQIHYTCLQQQDRNHPTML